MRPKQPICCDEIRASLGSSPGVCGYRSRSVKRNVYYVDFVYTLEPRFAVQFVTNLSFSNSLVRLCFFASCKVFKAFVGWAPALEPWFLPKFPAFFHTAFFRASVCRFFLVLLRPLSSIALRVLFLCTSCFLRRVHAVTKAL